MAKPEMSQEANGLSPVAGGLGVPEAWCTDVVMYVFAAAGSAIIATTRIAAANPIQRDARFFISAPPGRKESTGHHGSGSRRRSNRCNRPFNRTDERPPAAWLKPPGESLRHVRSSPPRSRKWPA